MPPMKNGKPWLPEHSTVKVTSCRGRALMSASDRLSGLFTRPSTSSFQVARVDGRPVEMRDAEELVVRGHPGIEILPDELGLDHLRDRGSASGWSSQGMTTSPGRSERPWRIGRNRRLPSRRAPRRPARSRLCGENQARLHHLPELRFVPNYLVNWDGQCNLASRANKVALFRDRRQSRIRCGDSFRRAAAALAPRANPVGADPEHRYTAGEACEEGWRDDRDAHRDRQLRTAGGRRPTATGGRRPSGRSRTSRSAGRSSRSRSCRALGIIKQAAADGERGAGRPRPGARRGDRGGGGRGGGRQVGRPLPAGGLADRLGHPVEHERQRGDLEPGDRDARRRRSARRSRCTRTTTSTWARARTTPSRPRCTSRWR